MFIRQVSVFMENKPGATLVVFQALRDAGVNIRALSLADAGDFGLLRLIVSDPEQAVAELTRHECTASINQVLAVGMGDQPGALCQVVELLAQHDINVEYAYAFPTQQADQALVIIRVDEAAQQAAQLLSSGGYVLLSEKAAFGVS